MKVNALKVFEKLLDEDKLLELEVKAFNRSASPGFDIAILECMKKK